MKKLGFCLGYIGLSFWSINAFADFYRVDVTTVLSVRAEPTAAANVIGTLARNTQVDVFDFVGSPLTLSNRQGRWAEIRYADKPAYVFGGFLKPVASNNRAAAEPEPVTTTGKHDAVLARLQDQYPDYYAKGVLLVDDSEQRMYWYRDDALRQTYRISTAAKGLGNQADSEKTPSGAHYIRVKLGGTAKRGAIFEKLTNTGAIATIYTKPVSGQISALVTSRIMRLEGLEPGKNKGGSVDTFNRMIYFHGTNKEGNLGKHASHGCIRMNNDQIIDLYKQVPEGTLVYIQP